MIVREQPQCFAQSNSQVAISVKVQLVMEKLGSEGLTNTKASVSDGGKFTGSIKNSDYKTKAHCFIELKQINS
ncbi:MAG: hypothetical protein D6756_14010 [Cyanobacteria bacterium J083]|nr:MAG: hypothetical protein D6756_14010 [Cyanobacteria bacterium J083]